MGNAPVDDIPPEEHLESPPEEEPPAHFADIVVSDDGPAECTIYPEDVSGFEVRTTWISAKEGSFVSLDDAR